MKIALINPPFIFPRKKDFTLSQFLGLRSISSFLKAKGGHSVHLIDALMLGFSNVNRYADGYLVGLEMDEIASRIPPDTQLIGITAPFSQLAPVLHEMIERIKRRLPRIPILMGGVYPSTQPQLALSSKADFIIIGEGEYAFSEIAEGKNPKAISGVYVKNALVDTNFSSAALIRDLDRLPFPDDEIPMIERYFSLSPRLARGRTVSMVTSRGCPFDCEFCSIHPMFGYDYRYRSAGHVLEEITYWVKKYGIRSLEIEDDNFTFHRERTIEILEGIIRLNEKGARLDWRTPNGVRIDTLDEEIIRLIQRSACSELVVAIEHGDPEVLQLMNKGLDLDKARQIIEWMVAYQIPKITLFVIVGYPGETHRHFQKSRAYLKALHHLKGNISVCVNIAQPYPGTKLLARCLKRGYIRNRDIDNFLIQRDYMDTGYTVSITTPDFGVSEVLYRKNLLMADAGSSKRWKVFIKKMLPASFVSFIKTMIQLIKGACRRHRKKMIVPLNFGKAPKNDTPKNDT